MRIDSFYSRRASAVLPGRRLLFLALLSLSALLLLSPARAVGAVIPLNERQMAGMSQRVIVADVQSVRTVDDAREGIVTEVILRTVRNLRGTGSSEVTLRLPGGSLNGLTLVVSETPSFERGSRVAVFLNADNRVVGGMQGKLDIVDSAVAQTGESLASLEQRVSDSPVSPNIVGASPEDFSATVTDEPAGAQDEVVALGSPVITAISPGSAPAGTGSVVRVEGSGFGQRGDASGVDFRYKEPAISSLYPYIRASGLLIKSWSDSLIEVEVPTGYVSGYPASAGSGPVRVITASGIASPVYDGFEVPFGYGGARWPDSALSQTYYVYPNTADTGTEAALVQAGASAWNGHAPLTLAYGGTVNSVGGTTINEKNEVSWADSGATGVLAVARYWYYGGLYSDAQIVEADIVFNDYYRWSDGTQAGVNDYDIQSVAMHEFGHWLNLRDLYGEGDRARVMYGRYTANTQKRTLSQGDIQGVRWIYGGGDITPPVTTLGGVPVGWTNQNVTVSLSAADDSGNAVATYYRLGTGPTTVYTDPFPVTAEGSTSLLYWSVDSSGNTESARSATVRIDKTGPETSLTSDGAAYGPVTITARATDPLSGVASTYMQVGEEAPRAVTSVTIEGAGDHLVRAWSVDNVGNAGPATTINVTVVDTPGIEVERVAGTSRYDTAVRISASTFRDRSVDTVVLATGKAFPDALSASGLAGAYGGPLLLTAQESIETGTLDEIERLGARRVVIVGGNSAVGAVIESTLRDMGLAVDRIAGSDRYQTAALVGLKIEEVAGPVTGVFLARGDSFADALAAAPYAYHQTMPILLTRTAELPQATADTIGALGVTSAVIAGGPGAVDTEVQQSVEVLDVTTVRVQGVDRYATGAALARYALEQGWATPSLVGLATGENFPDALGGGVAIGANGGVVALTKSATLSTSAEELLREYTDTLRTVRIFGGDFAISPVVLDTVKSLWNLP